MRLTFHRSLAASLLAAALCAPFGAAPARAADDPGVWQPVLPPSQDGGATAFDAPRQRMYMLGGMGTSLVYSLPVGDGPAGWEVLATSGTPPAPRSSEAFVYDSAHDCLWVFGGRGYPGGTFNDLWKLTLGGTPTWSQVTATGTAPSARVAMGACYEETEGVMYIFGGEDGAGNPRPNTLYKLDLNPGTPAWSTPAQFGQVPAPRYGFSLCDDPVNGRLLFFGGHNGSFDTDDQFALNLPSMNWQYLGSSGTQPTPRHGHFTGYDSANQILWVWGGTGNDGIVHALSFPAAEWTEVQNTYVFNPPGGGRPIGVFVPANPNWSPKLLLLDGFNTSEVYEFFCPDLSNAYWQNLNAPPPFSGASCVVDRARGKVYVHGGYQPFVGPINSGWQYSLTGQVGWLPTWLWSVTNNPSPAVFNHTAIWDDRRSRMVVFGGQEASMANTNALTFMQDTLGFGWSWPTINATGTPPSPRHSMVSIYDPTGDRMLIFGGTTNSLFTTNDLFQLSLDPTPHWSQLSLPGAPPSRTDATAIYDEPRRRMIVYGGQGCCSVLNDVWALNLASNTWTQLFPTGTPPAGRYQHTAVYDLRRQRMIVHAGFTDGGNVSNTWELNLAANPPVWSQLAPTGVTPTPRYRHVAAYDPAGDRVLVYGGEFLFPGCVFCAPGPVEGLSSLQFGSGAVSAVDEPGRPATPAGLAVGQPWPNPAQGTSRLSFQLERDSFVRVTVFDVAGRRVRTLRDGSLRAGRVELEWDGRDAEGQSVASGLYFYNIEAGGAAVSRKVWLVR